MKGDVIVPYVASDQAFIPTSSWEFIPEHLADWGLHNSGGRRRIYLCKTSWSCLRCFAQGICHLYAHQGYAYIGIMASVAVIGIQIEYCRRTYPDVYLIPMLGIMASVAVIGIQIGYQVHCVQGLDWHPDQVVRVLHQLLVISVYGLVFPLLHRVGLHVAASVST